MLIIEDFVLRAGHDAILKVKSLHIAAGEQALLQTGSSQGKSLLLKAIKAHYYDKQGAIQMREIAPGKHSGNACLKVELAPHLLQDRTVWQNLILPFHHISKLQEMKIHNYMQLCGLESLLHIKAGHCSYAQMKMIELVRAVAIEPYLLLLDDLDKYFDEAGYQKAQNLLHTLLMAGSSVLATSTRMLSGFNQVYCVSEKELVKCSNNA
jgi:ABC-type nitrate/sulfonate/bicarbonate transport system ATPase subunit